MLLAYHLSQAWQRILRRPCFLLLRKVSQKTASFFPCYLSLKGNIRHGPYVYLCPGNLPRRPQDSSSTCFSLWRTTAFLIISYLQFIVFILPSLSRECFKYIFIYYFSPFLSYLFLFAVIVFIYQWISNVFVK